MAEYLPTEEDQALWDQYIGPNGVPRLNISAPVAEQPIPVEPTEFDNDPFIRAAERLRRRHRQLPVYGPPAPETPPNYLIEPDLLEAQQGQHLPTNMAYNDAGIPFNIQTGAEIPTVRRPNVLPVASTPEGPRFAMPKVLDVVGNIMGGVAGAPVKAGEVLLGSGAVRKSLDIPWEVKGFEDANWFHGTTHEFDKFKLAKGNPENHLGQYPHFTTAPEDAAANYAGKGPDLTGRIERRAEQIMDEKNLDWNSENYNKEWPKAKEQATKELAGPHEGAVIPAKMKLQNPVSLVDSKPTWLDFNAKYDKDGEWVKDSPMMTKLLNSFKKQGERYGFDGQKAFDEVAEKAALYDGDVKASTLDKAMRDSYLFMDDLRNDAGSSIGSHVISNIFKDLGFDGIVMDAKSAFPNMKNIPEGTLHAVPLKQNTVKGKYSGKILYSDTRNQAYAAVGHELEKPKPFFSALERAVDDAKLSKGDAQQWLGYLKNQPGVKSEELNYVLGDLKGNLTKQEVQDIIKNNKVELKEVVKGELKELPEGYEVVKGNSGWNVKSPSGGFIASNFPSAEEARKGAINFLKEANNPNPTKYHGYQLPGGPLSRDTEILTRAGWKRIDSVSIGEEIITRKDESGKLEWQAIQAVPTVYAEKLYHFYNQSIDMQVTANHKMVVRKRRRSSCGIFRITAEQLWNTSECVIPLTGNWTGKGSSTLFGYDACDVAEFIGWYLAEGSYKHKNGIKNTIQIAQSRTHNPDNCDRMEALFDRLGVAWKYYGNGYGIGSKSINKSLLELLHNQPTSEGKFIPSLFFNENKHVVNSLLTGLILGDGHYSEEGYDDYGSFRQAKKIFFSKSKSLADGVQILALLSGYRASVRKRPTGIYVVGINSKEWNSVDDAKYAIVDYHDFAFCVTVENHCIYVRRNGVAAFTGNSDYKEMLLTLPEKGSLPEGYKVLPSNQVPSNHRMPGQAYTVMDAHGGSHGYGNTPEEAIKNASLNYSEYTGKTFKSSHWDEPNIIAHVRMNDRYLPDPNYTGPRKLTDADFTRYKELGGLISKGLDEGKDVKALMQEQNEIGAIIESGKEATGKENKLKTLHIEEIQSDWHQKGRSEGYKLSDKQKADLDAIENKLTTKLSEAEIGNPDIDNVLKVAVDKKIITTDEARNYKEYIKGENSTVPDAPFKKNWDELALKRMLHKAAVEGYEGISWTPGEAQAARYDLSKQIKGIHWQPSPADKNSTLVQLNPTAGDNLKLQVDKSGKIVAGFPSSRVDQWEGKNLADVIGKEHAEKILEKANGSLEGEGLKIGGEGMKSFYDKMLVDKANALVKKYGSKVEQRNLKLNVDESVGYAQHLEAKYGSNYKSQMTTEETKILNDLKNIKGAPIHYLPITPELRAKAKEGFPLFSFTPTTTPVDYNPFTDEKPKPKLVPVSHNPFIGQ